MSLDNLSSERVCYVHCNFCNTILAVSVPCSSSSSNMVMSSNAAVTVRCGRCTNLLSLTIASNLHQIITTPPPPPPPPPPRPAPPPLFQNLHHHKQNTYNFQEIHCEGSQSSMSCNTKASGLDTPEIHEHPMARSSLSMHPMGIKKQRAPSAYNRFIKEEIRRIKTNNPDISHREAFSTAAKNWAHLPHTHFGLTLNGSLNGTASRSHKQQSPSKNTII